MSEEIAKDIIYANGEPTPLDLLEKALVITLREYGDYYLQEMDELLDALIFIRFQIEPMFIKDVSQLKNIYNKFRDGGFKPATAFNMVEQNDIAIRFLTAIYVRWISYIADGLGLNVNSFINHEASVLADTFTSFNKIPEVLNDTLGQTLSHNEWVSWLADVPLFIVIFHLKTIDSDYISQVKDFTKQLEVRKQKFEFIPEG